MGKNRQLGNVELDLTVFSSLINISDKFFLSLSARSSTQMQTPLESLCAFYSVLTDNRQPDIGYRQGDQVSRGPPKGSLTLPSLVIKCDLKGILMKVVGILLIAVVLIAGTAGCGGDGTESCTLTISSTSGGAVTTPGHGAFTYDKGAVINLVAVADDGYRFISWTGSVSAIADANASGTNITMNSNYAIAAEFEAKFMVSAGGLHTVGLKADGSVVATGRNDDGECNVGNWTGIVQVAAGLFHTVGLKADGTVVAVGLGDYGQRDVDAWTGITQVDAGGYHTVGLKADGTVAATGWNGAGECSVSTWTGIAQVVAGLFHTVGLKANGTVVAVGLRDYGQCDVSGWINIIQVTADWGCTVGLKSNGTVVATGFNNDGRCNVGDWTDIVQVDAGYAHTVGLKADGTVVAVGWNSDGRCNVSDWTDIVQVSPGSAQTVGLRDDGTVAAVGDNTYRECDVDDWDLN